MTGSASGGERTAPVLGSAPSETVLGDELGLEQAARVLESMATGFFAVDRSWRVLYINVEGERVLGRRREELVGRSLWDEFPAAVELDFGRQYRRAMETGEPAAFEEYYPELDAWFEVRAQPTVDGLGVYFLDVTDRYEAQTQSRQAAERAALLAEVSAELISTLDAEEAVGRLARLVVPRLAQWCIVTLVDDDGGLRDVGTWHTEHAQRKLVDRYALLRLGALTPDSFVSRAMRGNEPVRVDKGAAEAIRGVMTSDTAAQLMEELAPESLAVFPLTARGRTVGLLSLYSDAQRAPLTDEEFAAAVDVADRAGLAVDNARAYRHAHEARREAEAAGERLALLARVGEALTSTLDGEQAVGRLTRIVVPQLADWCVVTVITDGRRRDLAWAHRDPAREDDLAAYAAAQSAALSAGSPVATALRTGNPIVVDAITDEQLVAALPDARVADMSRRLSPCGVAVMPLRARGRTLGVLTLVTTTARGPHRDDELATALEVARRAGPVLDNAQLYARTRGVAETLQRSLLTAPIEPNHLHVVTRYRPAATGAQVGGDWYDAFITPDGTTTLVIGDVMGHDIAAAAAMSQLRTMVRTIACDQEESPAGILRRVDAVAHALGLDTYATTVIVQIERPSDDQLGADRRLRWASAGHPPPMLLGADGSVTRLRTVPALPLGLGPDSPRQDTEAELPVGATLLLYTDGLVERRDRSIDEDLDRLQDALPDLASVPPDELCDTLLQRMLPAGADDDVALLALRAHPESRPRPAEAGPRRLPPAIEQHEAATG